MTSPASASFPWSQAPEPPSGEFRTGSLPAGSGGGPSGAYIAARGARHGPALLILAGPAAGYGVIHGLFRFAEVLDARRLAGSLFIRLASSGNGAVPSELLDPSEALVEFEDLRPNWQQLPTASYTVTGETIIDRRSEQLALSSSTPYCYGQSPAPARSAPLDAMAARGRTAVALRLPSEVDSRRAAVEIVFQGMIDILRVLGMLEGQLSPSASRAMQPPAFADAPTAGYWSPAARPGQRMRIDDRLGSFRDAQGQELGDLLTNISGILLGISHEVWVEAGQPVAELARPLT